jgi:glycosyltransferase involved in cell wall biosynthesis
MKRVAMIIGQLSVGGAEGQLYELVRGLDRRRFEPIAYSLHASDGPLRARLESVGVAVERVGASGPARARRLAALLRRDRIDVAHAWLFIANTYAWLARGFGSRVPLITSARNCKSQGVLHHVLNMAAFRGSACVVANSAAVAAYIERTYRAPRRRVQVIYNGVDSERFYHRPQSGDRPPTIVGAGRLVTQKNFLLFVEAAARVRRAVPDARFRIAGEGPQREAIVRRCGELGLEDAVELLGERADLDAVFRGGDMFWLTSSWEGLPNVVIEAMASGLPVVATDVGGTRELLRSGQEGFLVRPDAVDELEYYATALLRDGALRHTMGRAAVERARQFSLARMVERTAALYDAVCAEAA